MEASKKWGYVSIPFLYMCILGGLEASLPCGKEITHVPFWIRGRWSKEKRKPTQLWTWIRNRQTLHCIEDLEKIKKAVIFRQLFYLYTNSCNRAIPLLLLHRSRRICPCAEAWKHPYSGICRLLRHILFLQKLPIPRVTIHASCRQLKRFLGHCFGNL